MGFFDGLRDDTSFLGGFKVTLGQMRRPRVTWQYPLVKKPKSIRAHGRHVLNRYEDGMEKCIGCELCAGVCPADCIYVRGADNPPADPVSPGERYGFVYEINYLRCIHCDLCVEACPTEAITESKLFEFSFTNRADAIYTKEELLVDDDGRPQRLPWEDWREGDDLHTSGWMRATSPSGSADYEGRVQWSGELGYGVRPPEGGQSGTRDDAKTGSRQLREMFTAHLDDHERLPEQQGMRGAMLRMRKRMELARITYGRKPGKVIVNAIVGAGGLLGAVSSVDAVTFAIAASIVLAGAIGVVVARNPVHAALMLVMTLFGVAVLFVEQQANFLAAVQVIVYAGAIVVLFLFVIMFLGVDRQENVAEEPLRAQRPLAVGLVLLGLAGLLLMGIGAHWSVGQRSVAGPIQNQPGGDVSALGKSVFTTYLFAFEVTSGLLVIAVVGAVVLARRSGIVGGSGDDADADTAPGEADPGAEDADVAVDETQPTGAEHTGAEDAEAELTRAELTGAEAEGTGT